MSGPVLNNCSLNKFSTDSIEYNNGTVQIKSMEFADDLANPNKDIKSATVSNSVLENIQHEKQGTFLAEKCELLNINCKGNDSLMVNGTNIELVDSVRYLGDHINTKGNNFYMCKERSTKAKGTVIELWSLCKGLNFGSKQTESLLLLYKTVSISRLIHNCEAW